MIVFDPIITARESHNCQYMQGAIKTLLFSFLSQAKEVNHVREENVPK